MGTGTIGAKIVLEGEAQYRKALRDIKTAQSELRSEMQLANAQYSKAENSIEALSKKSQILSKQVETSSRKVDVYAKAIENSTKREEEASKRVAELQTQLDKATDEYDQMAKSGKASAEAMEEQQKSIDKLQQELKLANDNYNKSVEATKKYQIQLNYAKTELANFESELSDTNGKLDDASKSMDANGNSLKEFGKDLDDASKNTSTFGDVLKANLSSQALIEGLKMIVNGIKEVATASIESGMAFESAMSNVKALSGANSTELERLSEKAKELGASTIYSATEVADAMSYMSLAGWNTQQTLQGIASVLNLASASSMDLARASDIVTDYLTAFGLKAEDAGHFTDQMAYAMSHSNTTVEMLGESFKNVASTATSMGYSVEDVTSALMVMANAGVKGGEAGTALRSIMVNLATNTKGCASELQKFGVQVYDSKGEMNSLSSILIGTANAFDGLSDKEANALAKTIAGKTQIAGFETILLGLSKTARESGMSFEDYAKALEHCDGSAEEMAKTMQDNLKGKLTALESALEGLKISSYDLFDDGLKEGVNSATEAIQRLNASVKGGSLNTSLSKLSDSISTLISKVASWSEKNLPKIINGLSNVLDHSTQIGIALKGIIGAFVAFKTATTAITVAETAMSAYKVATEGATVAQIGMNTASNANPYVLLASALIGLTVATASFIKTASEYRDEAQQFHDTTVANLEAIESQQEVLRQNTREFENSASSVDRLVSRLIELNDNYDGSEASMREQVRIIDELNSTYPELNLAIDKNTGKLNMSTEALLTHKDALVKNARTQAYMEELEGTVKNLANAENVLSDAQAEQEKHLEKLADAEKEHDKALLRIKDDTKKYGDATTQSLEALERASSSYRLISKDTQHYADTVEDAQAEVNKFSKEYDEIQAKIDGLNPVLDSASESMDGFADSTGKANENAIKLSAETIEAMNNMYDSVSSKIESQTDLFEKFSAKSSESKEVLLKNLESQITGLSNWADNLQILAERGIDEGLYKKLAELGPEGANYVAEFVKMSDEELANYGAKFAEAMELEDSIAKGIAEDYAVVTSNIIDGIAEGLEDDTKATEAIRQVAEDTIDAFKDENGIHSPSSVYEELAHFITEGMCVGLDDGGSEVAEKVEEIATETIDVATENLDQNKFVTIGTQICLGLQNGIKQGKSGVVNAIKDVCTSAIKEAQATLDIHSPSRKFAWLGQMSGAGYVEGLESSMANVSTIMGNVMQDVNTVASSKASNIPATVVGGNEQVINQTVNVYAPTDDLIQTARAYKETMREVAMEW